jgi:hypothetical protein
MGLLVVHVSPTAHGRCVEALPAVHVARAQLAAENNDAPAARARLAEARHAAGGAAGGAAGVTVVGESLGAIGTAAALVIAQGAMGAGEDKLAKTLTKTLVRLGGLQPATRVAEKVRMMPTSPRPAQLALCHAAAAFRRPSVLAHLCGGVSFAAAVGARGGSGAAAHRALRRRVRCAGCGRRPHGEGRRGQGEGDGVGAACACGGGRRVGVRGVHVHQRGRDDPHVRDVRRPQAVIEVAF